MSTDNEYREVDYAKYCKICKHVDCPESADPCFECLDHPLNYYTDKPVNYEEKGKKK